MVSLSTVLQARANVKNNKYKDVYGVVHKTFSPAIAGMSGQIHVYFPQLCSSAGRRFAA